MSKLEDYRLKLRALDDWRPFLRRNSGLPGPRGNLELAQAVAELATAEQVGLLLATAAADAQENTPGVFLVFCGVTALGRMAAGGQQRYFQRLRPYASDKRWRVREAVATGLQYVGDASMPLLLEHMQEWVQGNR